MREFTPINEYICRIIQTLYEIEPGIWLEVLEPTMTSLFAEVDQLPEFEFKTHCVNAMFEVCAALKNEPQTDRPAALTIPGKPPAVEVYFMNFPDDEHKSIVANKLVSFFAVFEIVRRYAPPPTDNRLQQAAIALGETWTFLQRNPHSTKNAGEMIRMVLKLTHPQFIVGTGQMALADGRILNLN